MGELATLDRDPTPPPPTTLAVMPAPRPAAIDPAGVATRPGAATRPAETSPLAIVATLAAQSRRAPKTRQDYQAIYDRFLGWLHAQLGHAPRLEDLTEVGLLAWRNHRETSGGRGGTGLAPSSLRTELAALRVLARKAGRPDLAFELALPHHSPAPPESLSDAEYDLLVRVPDRRSTIGRRDVAILEVLGDAGLRSAELRTLRGADLVRARRDSPRRSLRVARGKGGRGRTIRLTKTADELLDRWLAVHPLRQAERGAGRAGHGGFWLPDELPLFCTLGRGRGNDAGRPMSADALEQLVARHARRARIPAHLRHPHALRRYCLTRLANLGVPIHKIAYLAGHADIRVTQQYLAAGDPEIAEVIDQVDAYTAVRGARAASGARPAPRESVIALQRRGGRGAGRIAAAASTR